MEIVNIDARIFEAMMKKFEEFVVKIDALCRAHGEKLLDSWLDNQDVCQLLNISPRTLQTLRDNGTMPHTRIGNKMYYKPNDIQRLIPVVAYRKKRK